MPVYEYSCEDCGRKFDIVATLSEKEAGLSPVCPRCGGMRARQVFGRFTVLSGSKTDTDDFETEDADSGPGDESSGFDDDGGLDDGAPPAGLDEEFE